MICKYCGTTFEGSECPVCMTKVDPFICPVCGMQRRLNEPYCYNCGYKFTDMAGKTPYSVFSGAGAASSAGSASTAGTASSSGAGSTATPSPSSVSASGFVVTGSPPKASTGPDIDGWDCILPFARIALGVLILLSLFSPVLLHDGLNLGGNGYRNAFSVYIDGGYTAICAILLIMGIYTVAYGIYDCVLELYHGESSGTFMFAAVDFTVSLATMIVASVGCSKASDWCADAGAGMSFCVFVGATGSALFFLRLIFSDSLTGGIKTVATRKYKKVALIAVSSTTLALVVALIITSIVLTCYTDPFSVASYAFAETREDVERQFGEPDVIMSDKDIYIYYNDEYNNLNRMADALDEEISYGLIDEARKEKLTEIKKALDKKREEEGHKTATIRFCNDGGVREENDSVEFYMCNCGGSEESEIAKLKIYDAVYVGNDKIMLVSYLVKYDSGSFVRDTVLKDIDDYDPEIDALVVRNALGEFSLRIDQFEDAYMADGSSFIVDDTLYVSGNVSSKIDILSNNNKKVKRIVVLDGVKEISSNEAFEEFSKAERLYLPDSLTYIDIKSLENTAFYKDEDNWDKGVALYAGNMLLKVRDSAIVGYKVKDGTVNVNAFAFRDVNKLESVNLPNGLKNIGKYAFSGCSSLKIIDNPGSVTGIGSYAFSGCTSLASITIPDGVTVIGDYTFSGCGSLESITVPDSVTSIGSYAFSGCTSLASIVIPDGVTVIGDHTFNGCVSLAGITIPEGVTDIDDYAFYNCASLGDVTLPHSLSDIGMYAFSGCKDLAVITIPFSVINIGTNAFADNPYLIACCEATAKPVNWAYVWIGKDNIVVWNCKYNDVANDGNVYTEVDGIRYAILDGEATVAAQPKDVGKSIEIPSSIKYKGKSYSVTTIAENAFKECVSLESVTIPASVNYIGSKAFGNCKSLTSADFAISNNWWCFYIGISSSDINLPYYNVAQPDVAAQYLKSTYANYDWKNL